jgi:AcrR family transcriptional regulator
MPQKKKKRSTYHHGALKEAVLQAALVRMQERKSADFTVPELARELGVTHGAVYKHFPSKRAIIAELALLALQRFREFLVQELPPPEAGWKTHPALAAFYVKFACENPGLFKALFHPELAQLDDYPDLAEARRGQFMLLQQYFSELLRTSGEGATHAALAHWAMVHGLAVLLIDGQVPREALGAASVEQVAKSLAGLLEQGIRGPGR